MRLLVILALNCLLSVGLVVSAEQEPEAAVKAAVDAFINAKDYDAVMQMTDVPFVATEYLPPGPTIKLLKTRDELSAYLDPLWVGDRRSEDRRQKPPVPDARVVPLAEVTKNLPKSRLYDNVAKLATEAAGADGLVAFFGERNEAGIGLLIRIRGDTPKVVGYVPLLMLEPSDPEKATPVQP